MSGGTAPDIAEFCRLVHHREILRVGGRRDIELGCCRRALRQRRRGAGGRDAEAQRGLRRLQAGDGAGSGVKLPVKYSLTLDQTPHGHARTVLPAAVPYPSMSKQNGGLPSVPMAATAADTT